MTKQQIEKIFNVTLQQNPYRERYYWIAIDNNTGKECGIGETLSDVSEDMRITRAMQNNVKGELRNDTRRSD